MTFKLIVVSPEKVVWSGQALSLTAPGVEGELTILAHHEPLIASLKPGKLGIRSEEKFNDIPVAHGVLEVSHNQTTVLL